MSTFLRRNLDVGGLGWFLKFASSDREFGGLPHDTPFRLRTITVRGADADLRSRLRLEVVGRAQTSGSSVIFPTGNLYRGR
jgi:hypothetical protein